MKAKKASYMEAWHQKGENDLKDFKEILSWDDLFDKWAKRVRAENSAWNELELGLDLLYSGVDDKLGRKYVTRCLQICDQIVKDEMFTKRQPGNRASRHRLEIFPMNRGYATSAHVYAKALLGKRYSLKPLLTIGEDMEAYVEKEGLEWNDHPQSWCLAGVRAALIAGDADYAGELLHNHDDWSYFKTEAGLLKALIKAATKVECRSPLKDSKLLERYDKFFDRVRSPRYQGGRYMCDVAQQRFEIGVIRHRWFFSNDGSIDWQQVIEDIRR